MLTEVSKDTWDRRCVRLGIPEDHVRLLCQPFRGARPSLAQWQALLASDANHNGECVQSENGLELSIGGAGRTSRCYTGCNARAGSRG